MLLNSKLTSIILLSLGMGSAFLAYQRFSNNPHQQEKTPIQTEAPKAEKTQKLHTQLKPLAAYEEVTLRPLFSSDRRPVEVPQQAEQVSSAPVRKPDLILTGVVLTANEQIALLSEKNKPSILRIKVGEDVHGWKLKKIEKHAVTLQQQGQNITLELHRESDPSQVNAKARKKLAEGIRNKVVPPINPPSQPDPMNELDGIPPEDSFPSEFEEFPMD